MNETVHETGGITVIPIEDLHPHPDNPRKDLGDLTELADSIKANGVLQNLTVVPHMVTGNISGDVWQSGYTVVIGHRRLAAAKLAGLKELPCVIREMTLQDQVRTMLMENIQRADLTIYEQAQGFQLMLNLGDTVEDIARKSGFSQTTVRRRVKLLELDQEKFKASVERGANLMDYEALFKISDPELRNEVLATVGTNNFKMMLSRATEKEKDRVILDERISAIRQFATELTESPDYSKLHYVRNYNCWDKKAVVKRPEDADTVAYYYKEKEAAEQEAKTSATERAKKQEEANRREAALGEASLAAYQTRLNFIKDFSAPKKEIGPIISLAAHAFMLCDDMPDSDTLAALLGIEINPDTESPDWEAYNNSLTARPEYTLLATAYSALDGAQLDYYRVRWDSETQCRTAEWIDNIRLDYLYEALAAMGYEMSDEEKALQDGTHELFE